MSQQTPSLAKALEHHFTYSMSSVYTSIPAIVVSVVDENTVNVQPTINLRDESNRLIAERPVIENVPLQYPSSKSGGLYFPIDRGDAVLLIFSMRGLDSWKSSNGYPTSPTDVRMFDVRDCIAIPGVYPNLVSPHKQSGRARSHDRNDTVLSNNLNTGQESEIRIKPDGDIEVNSPSTVTVNAATKVVINAPRWELNGDGEINGNVTHNGNYNIRAGEKGGGKMTITGEIVHEGTYTLNGVDVGTHDHGGVQPGDSRTDKFGG